MLPSPGLKRKDYLINQHLQVAWKQALGENLDPRIAVEREERIFALVCLCDPTTEMKYMHWLSCWRRRQWSTFGIRTACGSDELKQLRDALAHFHRIRSRLSSSERDISSFSTADELFGAEMARTTDERRALRGAEKEAALSGSDLLYSDQKWKMVALRTKQAAQWWGMGTRWCTAARLGNQFDTYSASGRLLVLVTPRGRYQLSTATMEFRDASDSKSHLGTTLAGAPHGLLVAVSQALDATHPPPSTAEGNSSTIAIRCGCQSNGARTTHRPS